MIARPTASKTRRCSKGNNGGRGSERKDDPTSSSSSVFPTSRYEQRVLRSHYAISPLESALSFDREKRGVGRSGMKFSESRGIYI